VFEAQSQWEEEENEQERRRGNPAVATCTRPQGQESAEGTAMTGQEGETKGRTREAKGQGDKEHARRPLFLTKRVFPVATMSQGELRYWLLPARPPV
jgi:hypothetical protein